MKIENEASFLEASRQGWNLFLGAGFSVLAQNIDGKQLPVGSQLPDELREEFNVDAGRDLNLPQICTVIEATRKQPLEKYLRRRCTVTAYDPRYSDVFESSVRHIFTTNIDDLVHKIYDSSVTHYLNDVDFAGSSSGDTAAVDFVALHGSVRNPRRAFKFATLDLAGAYEKDRDRWSSFREQLRRFPTVFLGYGLADAGTLQAIASDDAGQRIVGDCWMQVREETPTLVL